MTIGQFSQRTGLSPKALRIYGDLGLVVPARVDPESGYRWYAESQVEAARLVGMLRQAGMPLQTIAAVTEMKGPAAARALRDWWSEIEAATSQRHDLVAYLHARLSGELPPMLDVQSRAMPARTVACISRELRATEINAFVNDALARLRHLAPGLDGIAGIPFLIFYTFGGAGEDGDDLMELCRPVDATPEQLADTTPDDVLVHPLGACEEAYVRLAHQGAVWPALLPAYDRLERWAKARGCAINGAPQLLIANQRTTTPDAPTVDISVPLRRGQ